MKVKILLHVLTQMHAKAHHPLVLMFCLQGSAKLDIREIFVRTVSPGTPEHLRISVDNVLSMRLMD